MGIENREYMRDEPTIGSPHVRSPKFHNIVKTLIIINVIVFVGQLFIKAPPNFSQYKFFYNVADIPADRLEAVYHQELEAGLLEEMSVVTNWCALITPMVQKGQVWRLITYSFLHATDNPLHIFFNMFMLHMLGRIIVQRYGDYEFLLFYLAAALFSGAFYFLWSLITQSFGIAVGASGSVVALLTLIGLNWPHQEVRLYFIIPMKLQTLLIGAFGFEVAGMINELATGAGFFSIAHSAHMGGMVFGYIYFKQSWVLANWIPSGSFMKGRKRKPKLKIHAPSAAAEPASTSTQPNAQRQPIPADVARRVDEILEKISRSGEASLTQEERDFLHESSRRYRQ